LITVPILQICFPRYVFWRPASFRRHRFRLLREILSPRVLTPLVLAWYLIVKELEVRNLRLILKATFDAVPVEEIREYLVSA